MELDEEWDFGFSAVSEEELSQREAEAEKRAREAAEAVIKQQQDQSDAAISELIGTSQEYKRRLNLLYKTVLPLLNNLAADTDKPYIYWPDRKSKMMEFKAKIDAIVND